MIMRCNQCTTVIPHGAKFCPKCGTRAQQVGPAKPPMAAGALPSKGPIPRVGKLFIASLFVGLVLLALGIADANPLFLYAGGGILAVVAMGLIVGHHVS